MKREKEDPSTFDPACSVARVRGSGKGSREREREISARADDGLSWWQICLLAGGSRPAKHSALPASARPFSVSQVAHYDGSRSRWKRVVNAPGGGRGTSRRKKRRASCTSRATRWNIIPRDFHEAERNRERSQEERRYDRSVKSR